MSEILLGKSDQKLYDNFERKVINMSEPELNLELETIRKQKQGSIDGLSQKKIALIQKLVLSINSVRPDRSSQADAFQFGLPSQFGSTTPQQKAQENATIRNVQDKERNEYLQKKRAVYEEQKRKSSILLHQLTGQIFMREMTSLYGLLNSGKNENGILNEELQPDVIITVPSITEEELEKEPKLVVSPPQGVPEPSQYIGVVQPVIPPLLVAKEKQKYIIEPPLQKLTRPSRAKKSAADDPALALKTNYDVSRLGLDLGYLAPFEDFDALVASSSSSASSTDSSSAGPAPKTKRVKAKESIAKTTAAKISSGTRVYDNAVNVSTVIDANPRNPGLININLPVESAQTTINISEYSEKFYELINTALSIGTPDDEIVRADIEDIYNLTKTFCDKIGVPVPSPKFWAYFFEKLNFAINMADCNKDGTSMTNLVDFKAGVDVKGKQFDSIDFSKGHLKQMIHVVKRHYLVTGEIKRVLVARSDKGNEDTYKHFDGTIQHVAYDCGYLGFLRESNRKIVQSFGKYIDPSTSRDCEESFPEFSHALTIDIASFKLLGYGLCSLPKAICRNKDKYDYEFLIDGKKLTNAGATRKEDDNMQKIFVGNAKKNTDDIVSVLGKSMGDKLQVFIQFINYSINKERSGGQYCVATCDEVVMILCIILNLPCFYTSVDEVTINGKKDVKVNEILHYDPDGANFGNSVKRFIEEYKVVDDEYENLKSILRKSSGRSVYLKGHDKTVIMNPKLVDLMINDLVTIQKYINREIYNTGVRFFKTEISLHRDILKPSKDPAKINIIKTASNVMNAYTTRVIDMYPKSIVKLVGRDTITFNQTTGKYYEYGINSDDSVKFAKDKVALLDVIKKSNIRNFMEHIKVGLPNTDISSLPFSDAVLKTTITPQLVRGGGGTFNEYLAKTGISKEQISDGDLEPYSFYGNMCVLDSSWSVGEPGAIPDRPTFEEGEIVSMERAALLEPEIAPERADTNEVPTYGPPFSFDVFEKLYDELFEIYVGMHHETELRFPFEEYADAMKCSLFKRRRYDTELLIQEMTSLKETFAIESTKNKQIQQTEFYKMIIQGELLDKAEKAHPGSTEENIQTMTVNVKEDIKKIVKEFKNNEYKFLTILDPLEKDQIEQEYVPKWADESKNAIMKKLDPNSITSSSLEWNGGRRMRVKTRRRRSTHKRTHKRARKLYSKRVTKRRNKYAQKKHKTR